MSLAIFAISGSLDIVFAIIIAGRLMSIVIRYIKQKFINTAYNINLDSIWVH